MSTMRAMRRLKPDPVPDELINKILQAAQWAPSGGNTQRWRFLVVKDPEIKKKVLVYYNRLYDETVGPRYASSAPPPGSDPARYQRQHAAVKYLTDHYHEAPVWIVACLEDGEKPDRTAGSSIYPAVQNMLLATRARSGHDPHDPAHRLRERSGRDFRPAGGRPFLCDPADRLADGPVRSFGPWAAQRCRLSGPVGQSLPGALNFGTVKGIVTGRAE
jgi:nitroreductase